MTTRVERLAARLAPATTAVLTVECQRGVIGRDGALPELAEAVRAEGALANVAALVAAAHGVGATVVHAIAERRSDGRGANRNARLFHAAARLPVQQLTGSPMADVAEEIPVADTDLYARRLHGLSPLAGTGLDPVLRNLGCRTLVVTGVSANVAVPNAVFDAVNLGYEAVVPEDAIASVPAEYRRAMVANTLSLVATVATTGEILSCWTA
ncbi:cysteine hydrolase family protein [Wenjunlia tyrosinilytica]|uniref:Isochorismatase n=1 Tax=Wenjunlia tyrosinilytica TaxID=1544741 RepID=A0A917ZKJ9_9ACTN|nr:isochorismatase family protein [Wenjunlia tyrosinilytica]GGO84447.1 isochorismatase [Wenjunlia tyrosinilytica]